MKGITCSNLSKPSVTHFCDTCVCYLMVCGCCCFSCAKCSHAAAGQHVAGIVGGGPSHTRQETTATL